MKSREVRLKSRPNGPLALENFEIATVEVPEIGDDEVLVKNLWMSIDAGQRTLMSAGTAQVADLPPKRFELGEAMEGQAIGQVLQSRRADLPVGAFVASNFGWREYFTFKGGPDGFNLRGIGDPVGPLQSYLHINSIYGATAYFHVTDCARVRAGETVWISTAAGTTGSIACQIAQISGCKVVGTTGSDEKATWLRDELKLDAGLNYKRSDLREAMKAACPEGIDVFIDYAGGEQLEAAIDLLNPHGRIIKVGDTAMYDGSEPKGPRNMFEIVLKRLDLLGRSVFDYLSPPDRLMKAHGCVGAWASQGRIKMNETIYEGIESAPQAQIDLFRGKNIGKMLVKLGEAEIR